MRDEYTITLSEKFLHRSISLEISINKISSGYHGISIRKLSKVISNFMSKEVKLLWCRYFGWWKRHRSKVNHFSSSYLQIWDYNILYKCSNIRVTSTSKQQEQYHYGKWWNNQQPSFEGILSWRQWKIWLVNL